MEEMKRKSSGISDAVRLERAAQKARFSERLRAAIAGAELTREELARTLGLALQTVDNWLRGYTIPRDDTVWRNLASALGCSEVWLRGYKNVKVLAANGGGQGDAPLFEGAEKRRATQSLDRDSLPSESISICFHSTRDIYDRIRKMAEADNITLRAELTRCMKAYFEHLDSSPAEPRGSIVAVALGEDTLRELDAECSRTGESRSEAAGRLLSMMLAMTPYLRQREGAEEMSQ